MPFDFADLIYKPAQDFFGRPVTIRPLASQPGAPAYAARGIYGTVAIDVMGEDGSVRSDMRTILDILETEFSILPLQLDQVTIPATGVLPALGMFEVSDTDSNGGGETTLTLRKIVDPDP